MSNAGIPYVQSMKNVNVENLICSVMDNGIDMYLRRPVPRESYLYQAIKPSELVDSFLQTRETLSFYLSLLVVLGSEPEQRRMIKLKTDKKLRSIKLQVKSAVDYARATLNSCLKKCHNEKGGENMNKELEKVLAETFEPVKRVLRMPSGNPVEFSYPITDQVIALAADPDCREFLEVLATDGPVYSWQLNEVIKDIQRKYPKDCASVLRQLYCGKTREHLSAISWSGNSRDIMVTVVNPEGIKLTCEAQKFVLMVRENVCTMQLGTLGIRNRESGMEEVTLSVQLKKGRVVGWYDAVKSTLRISCLRDQDGAVDYTTSFVLDSDMVVSLYVVLEQLRDNRERFQRLLDSSDAFLEVDPFKQLKKEREA